METEINLTKMLYVGSNSSTANGYRTESSFYYNEEDNKIYESFSYIGFNVGYMNPYTGKEGEGINIHNINKIHNLFFIASSLKFEEALFIMSKLYPNHSLKEIIRWVKQAIE